MGPKGDRVTADLERRRLALVVEYDGSRYHGFQFQANASSIQAELEHGIYLMTGQVVRVAGSGRTDTGVHAMGQVVAFSIESTHAPHTFVNGLNHHLSNDIAIQSAWQVPMSFDPRREATSRTYRYTILNRASPSPILSRFVHIIARFLDTPSMAKASQALNGIHDFASFSGPVPNSKSTTRKIHKAEVFRNGDIVTFEVEATAFLPQQMRRMTGALVEVGLHKVPIEYLVNLILNPQLGAASEVLPPQGLCLITVNY